MNARLIRAVLLLTTLAMCAISILLMPFLFQRAGARFADKDEASEARLSVEKRFLQFNKDAGKWIFVTRGWPAVHEKEGLRSNRPVYPAVSALVARSATALSEWPPSFKAFKQTPGKRITFFSMLAVNCALAVLSVQLFFTWIRRHLPAEAAFLSSFLLASSAAWLWRVNQTATSVVAMFIIACMLLLFDRLLGSDREEWHRSLPYGLIIGVLMLAKAQYDIVLLCWLWCILKGRWRTAAATAAGHAVPLLLWYSWLRYKGYIYSNYEIEQYHQGTWIFIAFAEGSVAEVARQSANMLKQTFSGTFVAFSPAVIALAVVGIFCWKQPKDTKWFLLLGVACVIGFLVLIHRPRPYLVFDMYFAIFPFAAVALIRLSDSLVARLGFGDRSPTALRNAIVGVAVLVLVPLSWLASQEPRYTFRPALDQWSELANVYAD